MPERSVSHHTFSLDRSYDVPPSRVFAAWADQAEKRRWWAGGDDSLELDFRIGGREVNRGGPEGGPVFTYDARYQDIVDGERIVYTYDMLLDRIRISVSVATAEFGPERNGTRLVFTEQGAFLDGHETADRRQHGMGSLLDSLGRWL